MIVPGVNRRGDCRRGMYIVPMDVFDFGGTVDIYASGYIKVSRVVRSKIVGNTDPSVLGEIRVKRPP